MPRFTGTIFTVSPSTTNTTSTGLGPSPFLSALAVLVGFDPELLVEDEALALAVPDASALASWLVFAAGLLVAPLGNRVVTLAMGTDRTFDCDRVSMSAVTDMPGRKFSFSVTRIFTSNLVAS